MNNKLVRVLFAEEDDVGAGRIEKILAGPDVFSVTRVLRFAEVLKSLETRDVDVLLLSLSLPELEPSGGISRLRAVAPDIPIVVTVGKDEMQVAAQAIQEGAQDCFLNDDSAAPFLERIIHYAMERSRLLRALRHSEDRYRDLVEHSEDLICTHDLEGNLLSFNPAAFKLLGYDVKPFLGKSIRDILAPETHSEYDQYLEEIRTRGHAKGLMLVVTAQGERRIWEYNNTLRTEGVDVPFVRGMAHDVTEYKRVEKSLRKQARLLDLAREAILVQTENGNITFWNRGAEMIYGFSREAAMGKTSQLLLQSEYPMPREKILAVLSCEGYWEGELIHTRADGKRMIVTSRWALHETKTGVKEILEIDSDITERKRAEEAVRLSEERFQLVSRATNDVVWDWNLLTNETWWSENVREVLGYSPDDLDLTTESWSGRVHPEDRKRMLAEMDLVIAEKKRVSSQEFRFLHANGSYVDLLDRCYLQLDEAGQAVRMIGVTMDVTAQKRAQQELEESLSLLQATLESTADGILVVDNSGKIVSFNQRFAIMWGIPESIVATRDDNQALDFVLEQLKSPEEFLHKVRELYADPFGESFDVLEFKDGRVFERYSQPQRIGEKSVGRVWSFRDVTERERAVEALSKSEEKYRTLFEESKDVVFISTPEGKLLDMNPAGMELFGFSSKDELWQVDVRTLYFDSQDRKRYEQEVARRGFVKDFELTLKKRNGERLEVLETSSAVRDEKGIIIAYQGMMRDMTQLKQLQQQIAQIQRIETIGRLAGGVAHDFNNILMAITGISELLLMKLPPTDSIRHDLQEILLAADRGAKLARQMLAFSRRQILSPKFLNLNHVLSEMENMLRRMVGEDIVFSLDLESSLGHIYVDPAQIEQVVMNLVVNAREAMPHGGRLSIGTRNVELDEDFVRRNAGAMQGKSVMLVVNDTGCGMDELTISRLFEPFFTTKEVGKGPGLGLSTVYGIIKQSGGYILVSSEKGTGSSFRIYLPCVELLAEKHSTTSDESAGSCTVLLVDDNESVRNVMAQMLQIRGFTVLPASSGIQALEIARKYQGPIHLLISDVVMPHMSGPELASQLVSVRAGIKVLYVSGYAEKSDLLQNNMLSGAAFLAKPVSMDSIVRTILELMQA